MELLKPLNEGKTKKIFPLENRPDFVLIESKDDITAGNGAKHDIMNGKAHFSNVTTCNVFNLLKAHGIPVAFEAKVDHISFIAPKCTMLLYEVVIRRQAHGSYLKRDKSVSKGHVFPDLLLEFYLKTNGKKWKDHGLTEDDPYMRLTDDSILLYTPSVPYTPNDPFLTLPMSEVFTLANELEIIDKMGGLAKQAFTILEEAWQKLGLTLVDYKVEFGLDSKGNLLLADVIDNDSWRLLNASGDYMDKQLYREHGEMLKVIENYKSVAKLSYSFELPNN